MPTIHNPAEPLLVDDHAGTVVLVAARRPDPDDRVTLVCPQSPQVDLDPATARALAVVLLGHDPDHEPDPLIPDHELDEETIRRRAMIQARVIAGIRYVLDDVNAPTAGGLAVRIRELARQRDDAVRSLDSLRADREELEGLREARRQLIGMVDELTAQRDRALAERDAISVRAARIPALEQQIERQTATITRLRADLSNATHDADHMAQPPHDPRRCGAGLHDGDGVIATCDREHGHTGYHEHDGRNWTVRAAQRTDPCAPIPGDWRTQH